MNAKEKTELVKDSQNTQSQTHKDNNTSWQRAKRNELKYNCVRVATANELFVYDSTSKSETCVFCENCHPSAQCGYGRSLTYEKRKSILMKGAFCFRCIKRYHKISNCKVKVQCSICNSKKQVDVMHCDEIKQSKQVKPESKEVTENTTLSNNSCAREVFLQTLIVHIKENNLKHYIRVIIDTGSQKSYITKYLAEKMKLKGLGEEIVNHGLFGGIERAETHE
ncbi:uncharacterized protein TNCV_1316821 [Trichonephila clavipes]|nr:uncharacterized protein TNCV_1316821 [Trichonephila clavipes]